MRLHSRGRKSWGGSCFRGGGGSRFGGGGGAPFGDSKSRIAIRVAYRISLLARLTTDAMTPMTYALGVMRWSELVPRQERAILPSLERSISFPRRFVGVGIASRLRGWRSRRRDNLVDCAVDVRMPASTDVKTMVRRPVLRRNIPHSGSRRSLSFP